MIYRMSGTRFIFLNFSKMSSVDDISEYYNDSSTIFLNVDASSIAICDKIFLSNLYLFC